MEGNKIQRIQQQNDDLTIVACADCISCAVDGESNSLSSSFPLYSLYIAVANFVMSH